MTKKQKNEKKFLKIIYFDEESAIDYINISDGGAILTNNQKTDTRQANVKVDAKVGVISKFSLFKFLNSSAEVNANSELLRYGDAIIKSTLTNTILTDYIEKANSDEYTKKFENYSIMPISNSLTYWKMYTPYTVIFKEEFSDKISPEIDITKIDYVIDSVKGYYEMIAQKNDEQIIIRFNNKGFRNNYKLSNLMNMDLVYYGVLVGYGNIEQYSVEKEFDINEKELKVEDLRETSFENSTNRTPIYDIVLAGITNETK